jgi:hypothetical protein
LLLVIYGNENLALPLLFGTANAGVSLVGMSWSLIFAIIAVILIIERNVFFQF